MTSFPTVPVALLARVWWERSIANNGDHAFFRSRSCQNRRPAWGNSNGNPFMMAILPRKSGAYAKTGDLRTVWGNSERNPFILAIAKQIAIRLAKPLGLAKPFGLAVPDDPWRNDTASYRQILTFSPELMVAIERPSGLKTIRTTGSE